MKKYLYIVFLLSFLCGRAEAQFTLVSGTVTDTNGIPWSCATVTASIVNNNGQSLYLNGVQFSPAPSSTKLGCPTDPTTSRTSGAFSVQLADNSQIKCGSGASIVTCATQTQWLFLVNTLGILPPAGTGPQTCTATLTITGTSQSVTGSFSACPALSFATTGASAGFLPGCNVQGSTCLGTATTPALADWKQITDGTCTNSSNAISWGTPGEIVSGDVSKVIDITDNTNAWHNTSKTTIATVNQAAQTGTISQAVTGSGCGAGVMIFDVYTDNAPAFNSVELSCHNSSVHKCIIWYPTGIYGVASNFWNQSGANDSIFYWGGGGGHATSTVGQGTVIKVSPAIFAGVSGSGLAALTPANGDMRDLVVDGENIITAATNAGLINFNGVFGMSNVQFVNFLGTNGNFPNLCHVNSDNFTATNISCSIRDGRAMTINTLNTYISNGQFNGNPAVELADSYVTFSGGFLGTNATVAANVVTSLSGSGAVMATFHGTRFLGGATSGTGILNITKPSGNPVQVNLVGTTFDCGNTANVVLGTVGSGAIVQMEGLGNSNALGTTGCPGTPTFTNNGIFRDGGANGWGATGMTLSWAGTGTFTMNCNSWWVAPAISSGFGTSPSVPSGTNPCTFRVNVGGGGAATSGVVTFTQAAPTGWNCTIIDSTTNTVTRQTANTTTTSTWTAAAAWGANDILIAHCDPF